MSIQTLARRAKKLMVDACTASAAGAVACPATSVRSKHVADARAAPAAVGYMSLPDFHAHRAADLSCFRALCSKNAGCNQCQSTIMSIAAIIADAVAVSQERSILLSSGRIAAMGFAGAVDSIGLPTAAIGFAGAVDSIGLLIAVHGSRLHRI